MLEDLIDASKTLSEVLDDIEAEARGSLPYADALKARQYQTILERVRIARDKCGDELSMLMRELNTVKA